MNFYIMGQSIVHALLYALLGCFMMAMFSMGNFFSVPYFLLALTALWLVLFFFFFADRLYLYVVFGRQEVWKMALCSGRLFFLSVLIVLLLSAARTEYEIKEGLLAFCPGRRILLCSFFWLGEMGVKLLSPHRIILQFSLESGLLLASNLAIVVFFLHFDKNIAEQAVQDAEAVSDYVRKAKANGGASATAVQKVKHVKGEFPEGARAIFFKNLLIMRKTGNFLRKQDIMILVIYFVVSYVAVPEGRFYMFCYMLILWLFSLLNDKELLGDLKNYQIYLIPESPLKSLYYAILPAYIKVAVIISTAIVFAGILNRMSLLSILQYLIMLLGYGMIFIAGTVLSVRILKTRSNVMLESLLRMLIILACAVPATIIGFLCYLFFQDLHVTMLVISAGTLVLNFLVSALVIVACQGMMNGREL